MTTNIRLWRRGCETGAPLVELSATKEGKVEYVANLGTLGTTVFVNDHQAHTMPFGLPAVESTVLIAEGDWRPLRTKHPRFAQMAKAVGLERLLGKRAIPGDATAHFAHAVLCFPPSIVAAEDIIERVQLKDSGEATNLFTLALSVTLSEEAKK